MKKRLERILAIVLVITMVIGLFPASASAGVLGDIFTSVLKAVIASFTKTTEYETKVDNKNVTIVVSDANRTIDVSVSQSNLSSVSTKSNDTSVATATAEISGSNVITTITGLKVGETTVTTEYTYGKRNNKV